MLASKNDLRNISNVTQITGRLNLEPHSANYAHFTWEASDSGANIEKLRRRIKLVNYTIYGTLSSM